METFHNLFSWQLQDAFKFVLIHCRKYACHEIMHMCALPHLVHPNAQCFSDFITSNFGYFQVLNLCLVSQAQKYLDISRGKISSKLYLTQLGRHFLFVCLFPISEPNSRQTKEHILVSLHSLQLPASVDPGWQWRALASFSYLPFISPRASCPNFCFFTAICFTSPSHPYSQLLFS